mmetsp:Transcript_18176/g.43445  ORF Transcript_18176/g.43445 Transcript_18176/m.43445 type:complete len:155 (+) Transcript_18176:296-760(+)
MTIPPWRISGAQAAVGGEGNALNFNTCTVGRVAEKERLGGAEVGGESGGEGDAPEPLADVAVPHIPEAPRQAAPPATADPRPLHLGGGAARSRARDRNSNRVQQESQLNQFSKDFRAAMSEANEVSRELAREAREEAAKDREHQMQLAQQCRQQ